MLFVIPVWTAARLDEGAAPTRPKADRAVARWLCSCRLNPGADIVDLRRAAASMSGSLFHDELGTFQVCCFDPIDPCDD
jgi:hypothetical protein